MKQPGFHLGRNSCSETPDWSRRGMAGAPSGCECPLRNPSPWCGLAGSIQGSVLYRAASRVGPLWTESEGSSAHTLISALSLCFAGRNMVQARQQVALRAGLLPLGGCKEKRGRVCKHRRPRPSSLQEGSEAQVTWACGTQWS